MDLLTEILGSLSLQHSQIGTVMLSDPGAFRLSSDQKGLPSATSFSVVTGESIWMTDKAGRQLRLHPGDTVLLIGDYDVVLGTAPSVAPRNFRLILDTYGVPIPSPEGETSVPLRVVWGGDGKPSLILGVAFGIVGERANPLLKALPAVNVFRAEKSYLFPWIPSAIEFLSMENVTENPGFAATARVLSELLFVSFIRALVLDTAPAQRGWLKGLLDPKIARALLAIHRHPGDSWTVARLADVAGMSRTSFSVRFAELIGHPPIEYVTSWRIHLARCRLNQGKCNIARLAEELGYTSEAVFRQAFKRHTGVPPSRFEVQAANE